MAEPAEIPLADAVADATAVKESYGRLRVLPATWQLTVSLPNLCCSPRSYDNQTQARHLPLPNPDATAYDRLRLVEPGSALHASPPIAACCAVDALVEQSDMSWDMQQDAVNCAVHALKLANKETEVAKFMKDEFDSCHPCPLPPTFLP
eukprot:gene10969-1992_t